MEASIGVYFSLRLDPCVQEDLMRQTITNPPKPGRMDSVRAKQDQICLIIPGSQKYTKTFKTFKKSSRGNCSLHTFGVQAFIQGPMVPKQTRACGLCSYTGQAIFCDPVTLCLQADSCLTDFGGLAQ